MIRKRKATTRARRSPPADPAQAIHDLFYAWADCLAAGDKPGAAAARKRAARIFDQHPAFLEKPPFIPKPPPTPRTMTMRWPEFISYPKPYRRP